MRLVIVMLLFFAALRDSEFHRKVSDALYQDVNSLFRISAAGWCPLGSDVWSERELGRESCWQSPGRANTQPSGRRLRLVAWAGWGRTCCWRPTCALLVTDLRGSLWLQGVQVGAQVWLGWGPQRLPLAWMIPVNDWGLLPWILWFYSFHLSPSPS